jgi:enamine deaminase RidA (YjgF/YER057c/UK114 family)
MYRPYLSFVVAALVVAICMAQGSTSTYYYGPASPTGCVSYVNWMNQPQPTGSWSFEALVNSNCTQHAPTAGVRGWLAVGGSASATQTTLNGTTAGLTERVRQAFRNLKSIVAQYNATLQDVTSVTCLTYDIVVVRPIVNQVQAEPEFWGAQSSWTSPVYPPRTIIGSIQFNGFDCLTSGGVAYNGAPGSNGQVQCNNATDTPIGDILEIDFSFAYPARSALKFPYGSTSMAAVSAAASAASCAVLVLAATASMLLALL